MRITSLELTNFRSFQSTQTVEFAPLTLLFGPNSVGKSSVLMALFYVQQILEKGYCDPIRIDALGDKHIGGFNNLVNGRKSDKQIILKITCDKHGKVGETYNHIADLLNEDLGLTVDSPTSDADTVACEFHIAWSKTANTAYVACYKVWLDGDLIAELTSDSGLKQPVISYINYQHPSLFCDADHGYDSDAGEYMSRLQEVLNASRMSRGNSDSVPLVGSGRLIHEPLGFKSFAGALPILGKRLATALDLEDRLTQLRVEEILSDVVVAPLDNLLALLNDSLCIGPLRVVPDALHQTNPYPQQKDWYTGAAAWDVLGRTNTQLYTISQLLSDKQGLNLGYSLRSKNIVSKAVYMGGDDTLSQLKALREQLGDGVRMTISREDIAEHPETEQVEVDIDQYIANLERSSEQDEAKHDALKTMDAHSRYVLWDEINNIEVSSSDIGVGVSQLFPLVVASCERKKGVIACEQPELHVHPRVQVGIGDLLTQRRSSTSFLIETHSEHIILRVLRRIRETTDGELPEGLDPVYPDDVSIMYMEPSDAGVKARKIDIDEDGEFKQRWPDGFFSERRKELM